MITIPNHLTLVDAERLAWVRGDGMMADALAELIEVDAVDVKGLQRELASAERKIEELEAQIEPLKQVVDDVEQLWQDNIADGHWPCKDLVGDGRFQSIVYGDIERAGCALDLARLIAKYKEDEVNEMALVDLKAELLDLVGRAERILAD